MADAESYTDPRIAEAAAIFRREREAVRDEPAYLDFKGRWVGRERGALTALLARLKELPKDEKAVFGREINVFKAEVQDALAALESELRARAEAERIAAAAADPTVPGRRIPRGRRHPVTLVRERIEEIFVAMGYDVLDGPEAEDDFHNFEALNMPVDHPARDAQDTFFLRALDAAGRPRLLRTHTSPVQIRAMESRLPPLRVIVPGRTYRRDSDLRHSPMFHQVEALVVGPDVSFAHLKATLEHFTRELFGPSTQVRLRPSYFPFVEPGAEVDISCIFCSGSGSKDGAGCRVCSGSGWIEILGAGMVDPRVFLALGRPEYDPERVTGFAFGLGIDRVAMLLYGIPDLRLLFTGDLRLAEAFA